MTPGVLQAILYAVFIAAGIYLAVRSQRPSRGYHDRRRASIDRRGHSPAAKDAIIALDRQPVTGARAGSAVPASAEGRSEGG